MMLADLGANDTQTAGHTGSAATDICFTGHIVKVNPLTVAGSNNTLGSQHHTVITAVEGSENLADFIL